MPKVLIATNDEVSNVASTNEDIPIWDAVIDKLGDPRPYTPPEFLESYREPDDPWIDPDYFDDLLYELAVEAEDAMNAVDGHRDDAIDALDEIYVLPSHVTELHNMTETTTQFATVGALDPEN